MSEPEVTNFYAGSGDLPWDLKQAWLDALNDRADQQCRGHWEDIVFLYSGSSCTGQVRKVCAMTVFLDVAREQRRMLPPGSPQDQVQWLGLSDYQMVKIMDMNDFGEATFGEIAKWVDDNIPTRKEEL